MGMNPRLMRPTASGFNPKSISGLKLWLDAANKSSLTFNGSAVSQANDLSGNGFHATQGTANNQPTYQATGFNNKPTLFFDTTDSLLSSATIADYFLTPTTNPAMVLVMACYMPTLANSGTVIFGSDLQTNGRVFFCSHLSGSIFFDAANVTSGRLTVSGQTDSGWTTPHIMTVYRIGAIMAVRMNGTELGSKSNASGNFSATSAKLQIGKCDGGGTNQMYVSELVTYAAALSSSQIASIERGLARKWGVSVA